MSEDKNMHDFSAYIWTVIKTSTILFTALIGLNYVVDPYLIHQWDTSLVQRIAPAQQKITPWGKTYAVSVYQPEVIYLGSSRTEIGLPTDVEQFVGRRVFNLSVKGGSLGDAIAMLEHTSVFKRPNIVVWGLDYGWLFTLGQGNTDFERRLVATGSYYPVWRTLINLERSISPEITLETFKILMGFSEQRCETLLSYHGQKPPSCVVENMIDEGGAAKNFEAVMLGHSATKKRNYDSSFDKLNSVLSDYCQHGTIFRFYINPIHALNELYHDNPWSDMEIWKRDLVDFIDKFKQNDCDIRLMDFSGFNRITTEEIPQCTGIDEMRYYWEASHYKSEVGEIILEKLFSAIPQGLDSDFGVDINAANIDDYLAKLRDDRDRYCATHVKETVKLESCHTESSKI